MKSNETDFPERLYACWHPVGYSNEIKAMKNEPKNEIDVNVII